jgi:hypothetical protein
LDHFLCPSPLKAELRFTFRRPRREVCPRHAPAWLVVLMMSGIRGASRPGATDALVKVGSIRRWAEHGPGDELKNRASTIMPDEKITPPNIQRETEEDFASLYANNIMYEASVWDLKLIFGQLDQKLIEGHGQTVDYHTAITLPWSTVKSMIYFLRVNLATHEAEAGPVKLPERVVPARPGEVGDHPSEQVAWEAMRRIWDEEFGSSQS